MTKVWIEIARQETDWSASCARRADFGTLAGSFALVPVHLPYSTLSRCGNLTTCNRVHAPSPNIRLAGLPGPSGADRIILGNIHSSLLPLRPFLRALLLVSLPGGRPSQGRIGARTAC